MLILIAGKHVALRNALKRFLQRRPGLEVVGMAADKEELLNMVEVVSPDLLLLDENLAEEIVEEVLIPLQQVDSRPMIIVLGNQARLRQLYLDAGAEAFTGKDEPPKSLLMAIEETRLGGQQCIAS